MRKGVRSFLISQCFMVIPVFKANSVDPDQMLHSAFYTVCQCPFNGMLGINGLRCPNI